jgi:hypothetical protein
LRINSSIREVELGNKTNKDHKFSNLGQ